MKLSGKLLSLFCVFLFTGCAEGNSNMNYQIKDISDVSYKIVGNELQFSYAPMVESLYYSPGVTYLLGEESIIISVVRCNINDECKVDAKASQGKVNVVNIKTQKTYDPSQIFINEITPFNSLDILALLRE